MGFALLQVDGILAVDRLHLQGLESGQTLLDWWRASGVEVDGCASAEMIAPLLLRKAIINQQLVVPVTYNREGNGGSGGSVYVFVGGASQPDTATVVRASVRARSVDTAERLSRVATQRLSPPWARAQRKSALPE